jgi:hypothetical protein
MLTADLADTHSCQKGIRMTEHPVTPPPSEVPRLDAMVPPPPPPSPEYDAAGDEFAPRDHAPAMPPPMYPAESPYDEQVPTLATGPLGKVRSTGVCMLLAVVTLGIYSLFWYYAVHSEMRRHSNRGLDGGIAAVLAFFVGIVMVYITPNDVGSLYEQRGMRKPVSAATGLWYFPGIFILVGPIIWFVKTNGAINAYWRSLGAVG